jgi:hypothetical protein
MKRTPTKVLDCKSPLDMLTGDRPDLSVFRTWGCITQMRVPPETRAKKEKLASRTDMCLFLGYGSNTKGYKMMNLRSGGIRTCQLENALFHEDFTSESSYVKMSLKKTFMEGDYTLPPDLPIVHMKSDMESNAVDVEKNQPPVGVSVEPSKFVPKRSDNHLPSASERIVRENAVAARNEVEAVAEDAHD